MLELSSFQLERSAEQPFAGATILNLTEDHLDQHGDMAAYAAAKQRIYARAGRLVCNRHDQLTWPAEGVADATFGLDEPPRAQDWGCVELDGVATLVRGEIPVLRADEVPLLGTHNLLNVLAACALVDKLVPLATLADAVRSFKGLAHRFERVAERGGVLFVNDSKATNLGATVAALDALPRASQVVLIAGGDAKGVDLAPLGDALTGRVKAVITLGKDGPAVAAVARAAAVAVDAAEDMQAAVHLALAHAGAGDMVLLSPACASLDMYASYRARGQAFTDAVRALTDSGEEADG